MGRGRRVFRAIHDLPGVGKSAVQYCESRRREGLAASSALGSVIDCPATAAEHQGSGGSFPLAPKGISHMTPQDRPHPDVSCGPNGG